MEKKSQENFKRRSGLEHWQIISFLLVVYDAASANIAYFAALWLRFDCEFSRIPQEAGNLASTATVC